MSNEQVWKNLIRIKSNEKELKNDIVVAFEDYQFEGSNEIIVEFVENNEIKAFANHQNAPIFFIGYNEKFEVIYADIHE